MTTVALPKFCPEEFRSAKSLLDHLDTIYLPYVKEAITLYTSVGYKLARWWLRECPMMGAPDGCVIQAVLYFTKQPVDAFPTKPSAFEQLLTGHEGAMVGHFNGCHSRILDAIVSYFEARLTSLYASTSTTPCTPTTTPPSPSSLPSCSALSSGHSP